MYFLECDDEWNHIHFEDLWVYNKLFLSRYLGYTCGPTGTTVPKPDFYIVRPSFNILGMSRFARIEWIEHKTDHFHPSEFWCEVFEGEHISVDFYNKEQELTVLGTKKMEDPLYKWLKWEKINKKIQFPRILNNLKKQYAWINCEFIGDKLIEVHFRRNPDFRYNNSTAIPVWDNIDKKNNNFVEDKDFFRKGFYIQ
jgi:hypothetical protein